MIYKNVANQKLPLYLVNSSGQPVTGQAANITAYISVDGGAAQQVSTVVEVGGGYYVITPSQSQTNGDLLLWWGTHATHICRGGEAFTSRDYTAARAQALDNLDVQVSSRSTLTASDVWSYASRTLTSAVDVNMSQTLPTTPTANTVGEALKFADTRLDAAVSSRSTLTAQNVWEYSSRTLTSFGFSVTVASASIADIVDAVWDEQISQHTTTGSTGAVLAAAGSGSVDYNTMAQAVWQYSTRELTGFSFDVNVNFGQVLPATPTSNTVGEALKFADTRLDATVSSRSTLNAQQVWEYTTRTLTGFTHEVTVGGYASGQSPSEQIVGLGYTASRAAKLDNLDAAVSTRLAASAYTAPDNAGIAGIKSQTDKLRFTGPSGQELVLASASVDVDEEAIANAVVSEIQGSNLVQVVVQPLNVAVQNQIQRGGKVYGATNADLIASWAFSGVNLSGHTIRVVIYKHGTASSVASYSGTSVSVNYNAQTNTSVVGLSADKSVVPQAGRYMYAVRDLTTETVLTTGECVIELVPTGS